MAQNAGLRSAVGQVARRAAPVLGLAAHLGHGVQRVSTDAVIGRARWLPRKIEDLDAGFLSRIMGRTVTSVSVLGGDAGTSSRARLALTGDDVPESVFVKMPAETVAKINGEIRALFADPEFQKSFVERFMFQPIVGSPDEMTAFVRKEEPKWRKIIADAKIKVE